MIESISLENYKSFGHKTNIPLAPLTILCGTNSSGKSSILKSILMMKQTAESETPYNTLTFMGKYVDNGYWDDVATKINNKSSSETFNVCHTFLIEDIGPNINTPDIVIYKELKKLYSSIISGNIKFRLRCSLTVGKGIRRDIFLNNNVIRNTEIQIDVIKDNIIMYNSRVSLTKNGNTERKYTLSYSSIPCNGKMIFLSEGVTDCDCYFNNFKLTNFYKEGIDPEIVDAKPTILSFFNAASSLYAGILYIAPLRQNPERSYIIKGDVNSVGLVGENTPILYEKLKERTQNGIPKPYMNYGNYCIDLFGDNSEKIKVKEYIQEWVSYLGLGKLEIVRTREFLSLTLNGHNIADVGFGVSQILPIIIQGLNMRKNTTLLLEQPEIHLHPKMQMCLADFLLALASSGRHIIVETHSDHVINRIVHRLMENAMLHPEVLEWVKILFISKDEDNFSVINDNISVDMVKGLVNCPPEFIDQYGLELNGIMKQGMINFKARKENQNADTI